MKTNKIYYIFIFTVLLALFSYFERTENWAEGSQSRIYIEQPTFAGHTTVTFYVSGGAFRISGNCDPKAIGLEWSFDDIHWQDMTSGCSSEGRFSMITAAKNDFFIRGRGRHTSTLSSHANIRPLAIGDASLQVVSGTKIR